jgi:hypothetical protein
MSPQSLSVASALLCAPVIALALCACSTGAVDRGLFARTPDETYARVRAAVPSGTPVAEAQARMEAAGWRCYAAPVRSHVIPNDTGWRVDGRTLACEAYPAAGGYPLSKQYEADFLLENGRVTLLQVSLTDPGI